MGDYGQYDIPTVDVQVNFKVGQPAPSMLPLEKLREAATAKFNEKDPLFLQYGHIYGFGKARDSVVKFLTKRYAYDVNPDQIMLSNGVTGALGLICSLFASVRGPSASLFFAVGVPRALTPFPRPNSHWHYQCLP